MEITQQFEQIWFIEFDNLTLSNKIFTEEHLLQISTYFPHKIKLSQSLKKAELQVGHYLPNISQGLKEVIRTLYSFFFVEEKLTEDDQVKIFFKSLVSLLKVQSDYAQLFFMKSQTFMFYRTMASLLRGIRFYNFLYNKINQFKDKLGQNFFANMKQVYLYMLQRYNQILAYQTKIPHQTQKQKLQRLVIHIINMIIVFFNFPVKSIVFNQMIEQSYLTQIARYNDLYLKFMKDPQYDQGYLVQMQQQIDPVLMNEMDQQQDN